jgi:hypothetical protein
MTAWTVTGRHRIPVIYGAIRLGYPDRKRGRELRPLSSRRACDHHNHLIPATPLHLAAADHRFMGDDCVRYQFRVSGNLGPTLLTAFPALAPQQVGGETVLTGSLPDAAALYGVLAQIEALGLDLLEVRKLPPPTGG